mgnify:CR=1 FL=1
MRALRIIINPHENYGLYIGVWMILLCGNQQELLGILCYKSARKLIHKLGYILVSISSKSIITSLQMRIFQYLRRSMFQIQLG